MNAPAVVVLILAFISAVFSFGFYYSIKTYSKQAKTTVGTVVGRQGKRALVRFKCDKRTLTAPAASFDDTPVFEGKRVNIKYLSTNKTPDKWDIRIIGKEGYGQRKFKQFSLISAVIAISLLAISICLVVFL